MPHLISLTPATTERNPHVVSTTLRRSFGLAAPGDDRSALIGLERRNCRPGDGHCMGPTPNAANTCTHRIHPASSRTFLVQLARALEPQYDVTHLTAVARHGPVE